MLLQALTLIGQVCSENSEVANRIEDSIWLELDNFLNPLPPMTESERQLFLSSLPDKIYPPDSDP
jgi:hypothetical protein